MLSILIVDDEKPARDRLRRLMDKMSGWRVVGEASEGAEALEQIGELSPDALLLDISMPGMDGMSLARSMQAAGGSPAIIFCTAYQDRALEAFDVQAVDYVVKPVREERLAQALEKASRFLGHEDEGTDAAYIRSTVGGKVTLTPLKRVVCLVSEDKYTTVVHEKGSTVIDESLTDLEQRFEGVFFRVHRNALVSMEHLRGLERTTDGSHQVVLRGTDRTPEVSRRNVAALRKLLNKLS